MAACRTVIDPSTQGDQFGLNVCSGRGLPGGDGVRRVKQGGLGQEVAQNGGTPLTEERLRHMGVLAAYICGVLRVTIR